MHTAYTNCTIFTGTQTFERKAVLVSNGVIDAVVNNAEIPAGYIIKDLQQKNIAPAFIDLQLYGGDGKLFSNNISIKTLQATYQYCLRGGCAFFMITLATCSNEKIFKAINVVKQYWQQGGKGLLGLHLEGPFINAAKKGAHLQQYIHPPTFNEVQQIIDAGKGVVKMITLAPEVCDAAIILYLQQQGIIVCAGHSNATYQQALAAFNNGINVATHLFNAMSQWINRSPGMVTAIFDHPKVCCSIVCDGVHVDYASVKLAKKIMGERMFLITDAVTQTTEGEYQHLFKENRFCLPDGTLSGSALNMMHAVKNMHQFGEVDLSEALRMATLYPAKIMGLPNTGKIESSYQAGFVVFDDALNIISCIEA
jgi:N-acetylglucosamine-6-phosphate deacetylase